MMSKQRGINEARKQLVVYEGWLAYYQAAGSEVACQVYIRAIERLHKFLTREGAWE